MALNTLNFGESVERWISVFYANIEKATKWFKPSRGVRQGCPLSPYLFVLIVEILAAKIRQNNLIKGINLFGNEAKISQFVDDTNLFCADISSVENAIVTIKNFGGISGLQLNVKKTKAVWLGKWSKDRSTQLQLTWTRDPVKILGIQFSYDEKQNNYYNFAIKIQKLQTNLDLWKSRNLTLFGKVLIIKSLGLSQLVYSASDLNVPIDFINDNRKKLFSFLWKNKKDKIKRECLYQDYGKGGIRMPNLDLMLKALRLAWLPRLLKVFRYNFSEAIPIFFNRLKSGFLLVRSL